MHSVFEILFFLSLAGTVFSLGIGVVTYFKGDAISQTLSNKMMQYRVAFQAAALFFFFMMMTTR